MPRILLVEDDEAHAEIMRRNFADANNATKLDRVATIAEAESLLNLEAVDLVLADYLLPDGRGIDLIGEHAQGGPARPVVILTSHGSETVAAEAIKRGALDYIVKSPESFAAMPIEVTRALHSWELLSEKRRTEKELRKSLAEKEVILKEVHHRVKNNFQIVSSLLSLQAETIDDPVTKDALRESENRIRSMALIHEKLYESEDYAHIDFADYILSVTSRLDAAYRGSERGIALSCDSEPVQLSIESAIPLGLVLNELVTNAFIHAFPEGKKGSIVVSIRSEGEGAVLVVQDDGVGLSPAVSIASPNTLGLELIRVLTSQAGGQPEFSTGDHGTRVTIRIPRLSAS